MSNDCFLFIYCKANMTQLGQNAPKCHNEQRKVSQNGKMHLLISHYTIRK